MQRLLWESCCGPRSAGHVLMAWDYKNFPHLKRSVEIVPSCLLVRLPLLESKQHLAHVLLFVLLLFVPARPEGLAST